MTATVYSQRLGALSTAQFQAALDHFGLGSFLSAEPISRGLFGQNVFITSSAGAFVLRGCPHNPQQLPSEQFFARQVHERTRVPSPCPYLIDERAEIFGWPYAIMRRMPGLHLDDATRKALSYDDRHAIARAMGSTLAALGTATFERSGTYDPRTGSIAVVPGGMVEVRRLWMEGMLGDVMRFCPQTVAGDRGWIDGIVSRGLEAEALPFIPTIATSDFGEGNAVLEQGADGWRCSGVFDFMEYSAGDLEHSMTRPALGYACEDPRLGRAFLEAFAATRPLRPRLSERLAFYTLGDRLCIWNYGHSLATWFPQELSFRAFAEPQLQLVQSLIAGLPSS